MTRTVPVLKLKRGEDRRLRVGHQWVFSNEVDTGATPLTDFEPGDEAVLVAADDRPLGVCYVNPRSLIAARLVSRDPENSLGESLFTHRLNVALSLRERIYDTPYYRLVFGESDGLPGAVVDRFGGVLVAQVTTAGMDVRQGALVSALEKVLRPDGILMRNDVAIRELEGLPLTRDVVAGEVPEHVLVAEGGVRFQVSPREGQKTGWFYDQRHNRDRLAPYVAGAEVLDVFSYAGAWGLRAAAAGAAGVTLVDASPTAVAAIEANAAANGFDQARAVQADAFDFLKSELADGRKYSVVILDPPAFIKRKKDAKQGVAAYQRLNELALRLLDRDGILVTCSCSYHLAEDAFCRLLLKAARHVDRELQVLEFLQQGPDHPVHPAIPETRYLKGVIARVTPTR